MSGDEGVKIRAGEVVFAQDERRELTRTMARLSNDNIADLILSLNWLRLTPRDRAALLEAAKRLRRTP